MANGSSKTVFDCNFSAIALAGLGFINIPLKLKEENGETIALAGFDIAWVKGEGDTPLFCVDTADPILDFDSRERLADEETVGIEICLMGE
jgi:hypothetical protein